MIERPDQEGMSEVLVRRYCGDRGTTGRAVSEGSGESGPHGIVVRDSETERSGGEFVVGP